MSRRRSIYTHKKTYLKLEIRIFETFLTTLRYTFESAFSLIYFSRSFVARAIWSSSLVTLNGIVSTLLSEYNVRLKSSYGFSAVVVESSVVDIVDDVVGDVDVVVTVDVAVDVDVDEVVDVVDVDVVDDVVNVFDDDVVDTG